MAKRTRYTRVQGHREEINRYKKEGKTNQEIADPLGFADKWVVKDFIKRENRKKNRGKPVLSLKGHHKLTFDYELGKQIKNLRGVENMFLYFYILMKAFFMKLN